MKNKTFKKANAVNSSFLELERETSVFEMSIQGLPIWEWIRFDVYRLIRDKLDTTSKDTQSQYNIRDYLKPAGLILKNIVSRNPLLVESNDRLYVGKGRRKKLQDGQWWDIYCDPIHDHQRQNYVQMDFPFNHQHKEPAKTQNLRYLDLIRYTGTIAKKTPGIGVTTSKSEQQKLRAVESEIRNIYCVEVELLPLVESILTQRKYTRSLYKRMLQRLDPSVAVVVCGYTKESLIEICSEMDVPTVELQHGVIHDGHFGYHFPSGRTKKTFPTYLLVWGDFWKEAVEYPIPDEHIIPVGFPYLEQSLKEYENTTSKNQILFISQGTIGKQLSKYAVEVNKHLDLDYDVVYKIHPKEYGQWQEEYPWLVNADIDVVDSSEPPLYELFAESSAQIGVGSTAVYEGLCFDLETFVYDCPGSSVLEALVDEGAAELVSSVEELATSLGTGEVTFDREYYFEPNATENVCQTLQRLATEGSSRGLESR